MPTLTNTVVFKGLTNIPHTLIVIYYSSDDSSLGNATLLKRGTFYNSIFGSNYTVTEEGVSLTYTYTATATSEPYTYKYIAIMDDTFQPKQYTVTAVGRGVNGDDIITIYNFYPKESASVKISFYEYRFSWIGIEIFDDEGNPINIDYTKTNPGKEGVLVEFEMPAKNITIKGYDDSPL